MKTTGKRLKLPENPYILFLPFLLFYLVVIALFQTSEIYGDESRYFYFAHNLLQGFYSPKAPNVDLVNGPGYPLLVALFLALKIPLILLKLLNAVFFYLSIILLFKTIRKYGSFRITFLVCLFWACYYNAYEFMPLVLTEILTVFLVSALMLLLTKVFDSPKEEGSKKYIFWAGIIFGYIALTKVVFGYVIVVMFIGTLLLWISNRKIVNYKKAFLISSIALLTTLPYLIYTYSLTGRILYWSTISGNNLYWMTSPEKDEFGSWMEYPLYGSDSISNTNVDSGSYSGGILNFKNRSYHFQGYEDLIRANHKDNFDEIYKYKTPMEQDDAYKRIAFKNIKEHPLKYFENWVSNIGRILFNFPYSYKTQTPGTLVRLPMTGIIVVLMLFCLIPTFFKLEKNKFFNPLYDFNGSCISWWKYFS